MNVSYKTFPTYWQLFPDTFFDGPSVSPSLNRFRHSNHYVLHILHSGDRRTRPATINNLCFRRVEAYGNDWHAPSGGTAAGWIPLSLPGDSCRIQLYRGECHTKGNVLKWIALQRCNLLKFCQGFFCMLLLVLRLIQVLVNRYLARFSPERVLFRTERASILPGVSRWTPARSFH